MQKLMYKSLDSQIMLTSFCYLAVQKNFQKHFANKCQDFRLTFDDVPFSLNSQLPWNEDQGVESCIIQLSWVRREFWAMFRSR